MVRRVFGLYLLRSINEELRDLRSLSLYYRLLRSWFSSFSRRYKDKHFNLSNDLKSDFSRTGFFELLHLVFGLVFCSLWFLWVWGYWGRERGEVRCDFSQRLFLLPLLVVLSLPVPLNTIERVLLSDTPSSLLLSPGSLSDPTSTNI